MVWSELQGETKILKLKNLRPQDYANYSCIASVRNVCGIPDRSVIFTLTNRTGTAREAVHAGPKTSPPAPPVTIAVYHISICVYLLTICEK